ncbi:Domain of unknown function DUF4371 [Cinara cedri]|uniref:Uncharacterized protein n=1 Tax=Cinara cedri TaxID=506608 RepID=A0A5E4MMB0_9HEMI|nr:Domain of unknown function DUF4371 [Cinara cedri]
MERWLIYKSMHPYNVTSYLGSMSQNEFIELLVSENLKTVIQEIHKTELFAVMADTTPDILLKDQLAVCLRYIDQNGITNEHLLNVIESTDKTEYGTAKYSTKRSKDLTKHMKEIEGSLQLRNLSKTRWTRLEIIKSVRISLDIIIETLENIIASNNFDSLIKTKVGLKENCISIFEYH